MKLTKKKAIEISIELWTWLVETGKEKEGWEGWEKYGGMESNCPFCEYDDRQAKIHTANDVCIYCPYFKKFGGCVNANTPFRYWQGARTAKARREYARLFLEQLREL